jgi:hypothetical protein
LPWTHNLLILGGCKRPEAREFYLRLAVREHWSKRELERQISGCLFGRAILNPPKLAPLVRQLHPQAENIFKLGRSASPALIAEYQTALPDRHLLMRKLHEFYQLSASSLPEGRLSTPGKKPKALAKPAKKRGMNAKP